VIVTRISRTVLYGRGWIPYNADGPGHTYMRSAQVRVPPGRRPESSVSIQTDENLEAELIQGLSWRTDMHCQ
jgi:hypothetical protein